MKLPKPIAYVWHHRFLVLFNISSLIVGFLAMQWLDILVLRFSFSTAKDIALSLSEIAIIWASGAFLIVIATIVILCILGFIGLIYRDYINFKIPINEEER
jgi:hypothetical protein